MPDWPSIHRDVVAAFAAAWASPEPHAWDPILDEDVLLEQPMIRTVRGRAGWWSEVARLLALLPDLRAEVLDWSGSADRLFVHIRFTATLAGRPLDWSAVDVMRLGPAAHDRAARLVLRPRPADHRDRPPPTSVGTLVAVGHGAVHGPPGPPGRAMTTGGRRDPCLGACHEIELPSGGCATRTPAAAHTAAHDGRASRKVSGRAVNACVVPGGTTSRSPAAMVCTVSPASTCMPPSRM